MVLLTSVFLIELLCVIVPCDPRYRLPDLSSDPDKIDKSLHYQHLFHKKSENSRDGFLYRNSENELDSDSDNEISSAFISDASKYYKTPPPFVRTYSGDVEGYFMKVVGGRKINAFEGIPYAEPPIGRLRFRVWSNFFN
jgi:hypothetical protein